MAGEVVPFEFVKGRTDTSDLRALTRPTRTMTPRERWVCDQLAIDWAELTGLEQKVLYAEGCIGRLAVDLQEVFNRTATALYEDVDATVEKYGRARAAPKRDDLVGTAKLPRVLSAFTDVLVDNTATNMLRLNQVAAHEAAKIAVRSLDPPSEAELAPRVIVQRGFWQRLLSGDGYGPEQRRSDWQR